MTNHIPISIGMTFRPSTNDAPIYKVLGADVDKNTVKVTCSYWNVDETEEWYYDVLLEGLNNKNEKRFYLPTEEFPKSVTLLWISVEDQLPTPSIKPNLNKVLIYSDVLGIGTGYYWGIGDKPNDPLKGWCTMGVTHWMPMIDPPQHIKNK